MPFLYSLHLYMYNLEQTANLSLLHTILFLFSSRYRTCKMTPHNLTTCPSEVSHVPSIYYLLDFLGHHTFLICIYTYAITKPHARIYHRIPLNLSVLTLAPSPSEHNNWFCAQTWLHFLVCLSDRQSSGSPLKQGLLLCRRDRSRHLPLMIEASIPIIPHFRRSNSNLKRV